MRDIVSENGRFLSGLTPASVTISATQTSPIISAKTVAAYDGLLIYILCGAITGAGVMTVTLQCTNDDGSGSAGTTANWTNVPNSDLILWTATSTTDFTPVRIGNRQPIPLTTGSGTAINQRLGYLGTPQTFVSGNDGLTYSLDWFRVASILTVNTWSAVFDVIINLGRPRHMPSEV